MFVCVCVCYSNIAVYASSSFLLFNGYVAVDPLFGAAPINCLFCVCSLFCNVFCLI